MLFWLLIVLLVAALGYVFRPGPATTNFGGPWQGYVSSDFQVTLPKRYVGGLGSSGAAAAIAEAAKTNTFYEKLAKPLLADLPADETRFWAIAPIDCCQTWGEVAGSFVEDDSDPMAGHSGVAEVLILKFPAEQNETLAEFRDSLADPVYTTQEQQQLVLAGQQAIRLVRDEGDNRHLTYLVDDRAAFWVLDFTVDRDTFGAFVSLLERSAHSFRLLAAR